MTIQFTVLPFGFTLASRVFTKLEKVIDSQPVLNGVHLLYLNSWLVMAPSEETAEKAVTEMTDIAHGMSFKFYFLKSSLTPSQTVVWVGMEWDMHAWSLPF